MKQGEGTIYIRARARRAEEQTRQKIYTHTGTSHAGVHGELYIFIIHHKYINVRVKLSSINIYAYTYMRW